MGKYSKDDKEIETDIDKVLVERAKEKADELRKLDEHNP